MASWNVIPQIVKAWTRNPWPPGVLVTPIAT